ncbi:MOSC domain-containing protein [Bacillus sp. BP-3]|uniref:MOSC domain-containing protein n=1 Tax=Bacillus sp. BP-3 TaxID=3022773 RepID=UPI00232EC210|nr:MOSC domain-containing protein [Bacillus sp. BP-3]MDC2864773.1 MOSC domain-containing protein [Bacillus sp. BP-3]
MPHIISINIGTPQKFQFQGKEIETGLFKKSVNKPLHLSTLNFEGDGQADLKHHGGKDKAVCIYAIEHYPYWEQELTQQLPYGAFGENLTVTGLLESDVCIGDIYKIGEALVQVTQPRQPCYKLSYRYDLKDFPLLVQNTGFTGFYVRVLTEGTVSPSDEIKLIEQNKHRITIAFANEIMHHDKQNIEGIQRILAVDSLSGSWRNTFKKRLEGKETSTEKRLTGK